MRIPTQLHTHLQRCLTGAFLGADCAWQARVHETTHQGKCNMAGVLSNAAVIKAPDSRVQQDPGMLIFDVQHDLQVWGTGQLDLARSQSYSSDFISDLTKLHVRTGDWVVKVVGEESPPEGLMSELTTRICLARTQWAAFAPGRRAPQTRRDGCRRCCVLGKTDRGIPQSWDELGTPGLESQKQRYLLC
jgi:hypothetical protein